MERKGGVFHHHKTVRNTLHRPLLRSRCVCVHVQKGVLWLTYMPDISYTARACMHIHIYMYMYANYACMLDCMYVCIYKSKCMDLCVCMTACVRVCICILIRRMIIDIPACTWRAQRYRNFASWSLLAAARPRKEIQRIFRCVFLSFSSSPPFFPESFLLPCL